MKAISTRSLNNAAIAKRLIANFVMVYAIEYKEFTNAIIAIICCCIVPGIIIGTFCFFYLMRIKK